MSRVAIRFKKDNADVILAPLTFPRREEWAAHQFLDLLPPREAYPSYLDELDVDGDVNLRAERQRLEAELEQMDEKISAARQVKRILYLTGFELEAEVVRFLNDELTAPARAVGGNAEDFRLCSDDTDWCIGEVKAVGRGITRGHVSQLDAHRSDAGLDDNFPALLVVNCGLSKSSLQERDEPVHHNVSQHAENIHIAVVRTLDLIRLRNRTRETPSALDDFLAFVRGGGGWYEVAAQETATLVQPNSQ